MNLLFTKDEFVSYIEFIKKQQEKQEVFISALETLAPGEYCNVFLYAEYESKLLEILHKALNDEYDDIGYKMWEFDCFSPEQKANQLKETPWLESWESLYDHLVENLENTVL